MEISTQQAAALVGVSAETIRNWCNLGYLKHKRVGFRRDYRIDRDDLIRSAEELGHTVDDQQQ